MCREAGAAPAESVPAGVEAVRRAADDRSYLFLINHTGEDVSVPLDGRTRLDGSVPSGPVVVPAGDVVVLREVGTAEQPARPHREEDR
nr:Beta-galactosidase C-terminal domain [Streptomyces sp. FT05W]